MSQSHDHPSKRNGGSTPTGRQRVNYIRERFLDIALDEAVKDGNDARFVLAALFESAMTIGLHGLGPEKAQEFMQRCIDEFPIQIQRARETDGTQR